ncbi:MAG: nitroreductase family protein [Pseudoflavonifractor sp.]|nr:nitroreductase family protein [Alloprevotella sp.]MCM1116373.1 nitroreductase family protein [Pseudoflavonifractor sp.]
MKTVKSTLLERRSVRRYEREEISDETLEFIYQAIRNTPTSYNGQQFSVIDVSDPAVKEQLYELIGQKQVKTCAHFLLFLADFHKIAIAARAKDIELPGFAETADGVIVGVVDAALAMMSALAAAEASGLGACCIGYARTAAPEAIAKVLGLPPLTFVVCGLAIGVPREKPDMKPKQPMSLVIHANRYGSDEALLPALEAYDDEISHYNQTRSGTTTGNDWTGHIIGYYREAMSYRILNALRRQGFDVRT